MKFGTPGITIDDATKAKLGDNVVATVDIVSADEGKFMSTLTVDGENVTRLDDKGSIMFSLPVSQADGPAGASFDPYCILVTFTDESGNKVVIKEMYYDQTTGILNFRTNIVGPFTVSIAHKQFPDMIGHWAERIVETLASKGIIAGVDSTSFEPERDVTRAEYTRMLMSAFELSLPDFAPAIAINYSDVPAGEWYYSTIERAQGLNFISGYPEDGTFKPDNPISRQEMAEMTSRFIDSLGLNYNKTAVPAVTYTDADMIADWAADAISSIQQMGIFNGMGDGSFAPQKNTTRAEAASVLLGMIKLLFK